MKGGSDPSGEGIAFPPSAPAIPATIGRYEVVDVLGQGGMASVYLARMRGPAGFQKLFAIKCVHPHLAHDPHFVRMFLDEARIAAALHHPNVAEVLELGEANGAYFLAMEYLHGEHLGTVYRRLRSLEGRPRLAVVLEIMARVADGLHHAHEAQDDDGQALSIVHRDVSPQNVFVTYTGQVKLTDFGIAKATSNEVRTDTGTVKGKFAYMSPEQALGRTLDRRSDVFALGALLWEGITQERLFRANTDAETLLKVTRCEVAPPSSMRAGCPPELDRLVMRCLTLRPEDRMTDAAAVSKELGALRGTVVQAVAGETIESFMSELFATEITKRQAQVRRARGDRSAAVALETPPDDDTRVLGAEATDTVTGARVKPVLELVLSDSNVKAAPEPGRPSVPPTNAAAVPLIRAPVATQGIAPTPSPPPSRRAWVLGAALLALVALVFVVAQVLPLPRSGATGETVGGSDEGEPDDRENEALGVSVVVEGEGDPTGAPSEPTAATATEPVLEPSAAAIPHALRVAPSTGATMPVETGVAAVGAESREPVSRGTAPRGTVSLSVAPCSPYAEVFLGRRRLGTTPLVVDVPAGPVALRLVGSGPEHATVRVPLRGADGDELEVGTDRCP